MVVILAGEVVITQRDEFAGSRHIVTYGRGSFMGELAQLSGRPALVDARAQGAVEALVIPPHRLRDVMVREADLGERIMRALILRRVNLLESGAGGPVIIGPAGNGDVLRLVLRQAAAVLLAGLGAGLVGGALLGRAASAMLFSVSPADPTVYAAAAGCAALIAAAATVVPATRALSVDPVRALRYE